ncbi:MAG: hypothetical protein OHK0012_22510 [Synechococcales cyanobacterium]
MNNSASGPPSEPIGQILKRAGLLSDAQIQIALNDQTLQDGLLFGEVLVLRGWLKAKTLDFFLEHFVAGCRADQAAAAQQTSPRSGDSTPPEPALPSVKPPAKTVEEDLSQFYRYAPPTGAQKIPSGTQKVVNAGSQKVATGSLPLSKPTSKSQSIPIPSKPPSHTTGKLHIHGYCVQTEDEDDELVEEDWSDLDIADNPRYLR